MFSYITTYEEAAEYICRIPRFNSNHSLEKIKHFLTYMGQPDKKMKIIHIAGTNGKGSTAVYLAGLLEQAGLKVGLFTSPHLVEVRERFRINDEMISKELFTEAVQYIHRLLDAKEETDYQPCFFDMMFFVGMYAFAKERVDILVLETGLGGRLDATNAVSKKALSLITHIGLDHTEYLGNTVEAIAEEKAGIMQADVPCIVAPRNDSVSHVFMKKAAKLGCPCRILGKGDYACQGVYEKAVAFSYFSGYYGTIPIKLNTTALYQAENASLALAGLERLMEQGIVPWQALNCADIKQALWQTQWAGRMEEIAEGVFLDGAHNEDGIEAFLGSVRMDNCSGKRILVFSAVSDKDLEKIANVIYTSKLFSRIIITQLPEVRGAKVAEIVKCFRGEAEERQDMLDAFMDALVSRKKEDYIYITGSLYLVGHIKKMLSA